MMGNMAAAKPAQILTMNEMVTIRPSLQGRMVMTSGGFAPVHPGHQSVFIDAANLPFPFDSYCPYDTNIVVVVVNGDRFLTNKHGYAFQDEETRCRIISMCLGVDYVVPFTPRFTEDQTVVEAIQLLRPNVFAKGGDRMDERTIPEWNICREVGTQIVTGLGAPKLWSSSDFIGNYTRWFCNKLGRKSN
jgi:bifunctional ADP-heptose synthase (sugar kinase/adenylyltransferase)